MSLRRQHLKIFNHIRQQSKVDLLHFCGIPPRDASDQEFAILRTKTNKFKYSKPLMVVTDLSLSMLTWVPIVSSLYSTPVIPCTIPLTQFLLEVWFRSSFSLWLAYYALTEGIICTRHLVYWSVNQSCLVFTSSLSQVNAYGLFSLVKNSAHTCSSSST